VLAALAMLLHLLWILWVILGWIVTLNRALLRWVHIGSLLWGILMGGRALAVSYQGSFLIHYLGGDHIPVGGEFVSHAAIGV